MGWWPTTSGRWCSSPVFGAEVDIPDDLDVVVVGDVITDTIVCAQMDRVDDADTTSSITRTAGGQGANQAAWLTVAGARTAVIARVGSADIAMHRAQLLAIGVEPLLSVDPVLPSGEIVVIVDARSGARHMYTQRGAAAELHPLDISATDVARARWVHVSGYVLGGTFGPEVMERLGALAAATGVPVSLDPASITEIARLGPAAFLGAGASVIFPNIDEVRALTGVHDVEQAVRALGDSVPIVVASLGADGAMAFNRETGQLLYLRASPVVAVVDTTGAGDALAAGFLAGHVSGASLADALHEGLDLAATAISRVGAH